MSTTQIRGLDTDNYIVLTQYDASSNLEVALTQALVQSAYNKTTIEPGNTYTSPANNSSWNSADISNNWPNYINTSAISNYPAGTVTEYSVISSELITTDVSTNSYSTNISSDSCANNTYLFNSLNTSAPYYDANYVITQSLQAICSDNDTGNYVEATFDVDAANAKIQYAMQSRWNTTTGPYSGLSTVGGDPTAMSQSVDNTTTAFAKYGTGATDASYVSYWFEPSATGLPTSYQIDASYQPIQNNLLVGDRDMTEVTLTVDHDVGIFRIQQSSNSVVTDVTLDFNTHTITTNDLDNMPLFNGYGQDPSGILTYNSSKTALPIPGEMTSDQFRSLLNTDVYNTVADDWTFTVNVTDGSGGYAINTSHPLTSQLDDSNLLDNPYYMANYVSNAHSINFSNATITIDASTNGTSTDANSIAINLTNGETLNATYAGVDGQIIINTNTVNTRYTDMTSVDLSGNFAPVIRYDSDGASLLFLSNEEMTNPYFQGMWQKVAQSSQYTSPDYWLKSSNNSIMTLYTQASGIIDNSFNATDFDFSFNSGMFTTNDIQLWKITGTNNIIVNPQSFYADSAYTVVEPGIATSGLLTGLTDDLSYNSYRILLSAKEKEDLGLYQAVQDASGWDLTYTTGTFLYSSAAQAYSKTNLPIYDQTIISDINSGTTLNYSYTYKTIQDASSAGGLVDYVDISYNYNTINYVVTIDQTDINRTYDNAYTNVSYVVVDPSAYTFTNPVLNKASYELVHVTANSKYDATFLANYGPFTNAQLTVQDILQTDEYYAVRYKTNGTLSPQSVLAYVVAPSIPNLRVVHEAIQPTPGNSLSISGTFTANDLKPFMSITQGETSSSTWVNIGTSIQTDVYYGLVNEEDILTTASLLTTIQYTPFSNSINSSINVDLELLNYYIPFVYDQSGNVFTLQSFTASTTTLDANTSIGSTSFLDNTSYLSLTNAYENVNWVNTQYTLDMYYNIDTDSTSFIAKDLSGNTVFEIDALNNTIFLGTYIVSYIPRDYYRAERVLGQSSISNTYTETFITTNYSGGRVNLSTTLQGVYIGSTSYSLSSTLCPNLGSYQYFRVLGDYMSINEIGTASSPTSAEELGIASYNGGSLTFQYVSGSNHSAIFTFPKYRGYKSYVNTNPDEYYTINRDATVVTFDVDSSGSYTALTDTLTSNMYYEESFVVDTLLDASSHLVANLNVTGVFNYSIPPTGFTLSYPVTVTGDQVSVTISNPNYTGSATNIHVDASATAVNDPKSYTASMTLKDYGRDDMYTFSGNWYVDNRLMAIRPSRVKLYNIAYPYSTLSYKMQVMTQSIRVYKAINQTNSVTYNWFGNPALKGLQDPNVDPSSSLWLHYATYDMSAIYQGINIGVKTIYQNSDLPVGFRLVYIVSTPPYYKFEQISTESCPSIPYDYNTQYISNQTTRYMPYIDPLTGALTSTFNPFAPSTSYVDINGNTTTITSDSSILNNVAFTLSSAPSITDAVENPNTTRYGIIVPGTYIEVQEYMGLYNSTDSGAHSNPIWSGPVTSIPSTANIDSNALIFRDRDASGAIYFSALQYPADIGYPSGATGYQQIFRTDVSSNWYNIDFKMGNSAWFNDNTPVTYFDVNANGIRPTLYTVVDVNDPVTQINKRRVYKYTTDSSIDIDVSGGSTTAYQTFNLTFNSRRYHDFDISSNSVFPSSGMWYYNDLVNQTVIPNTPITWTVDASYTNTAYVSWAFGNSTTATQMLNLLFSVQDNQQKWVYVQLEPFMRYMNQFNMQVGSIAWDGSVTAPLVSTRVVELSPAISNPTLNNVTYSIQEYSESTL